MQFPRINLNGSDAQRLIDLHREVWNAADALLTALANATPHGRDFQTFDDPSGSWRRAMAEAQARYDAVLTVRKEAEAIALHVQDQEAERGR